MTPTRGFFLCIGGTAAGGCSTAFAVWGNRWLMLASILGLTVQLAVVATIAERR